MIHLTGSYLPRVCGIADYTASLVQALAERGVEGRVWTRDAYALRPETVGIAPSFDPDGFARLFEKLRTERPKLVHLQYEPGIWDQNPDLCVKLPGAVKRCGARLVTTLHTLGGPFGWGRASRLGLIPLLSASDAVLVCSRKQQETLARVPGLGRRLTLTPVGNVIPVVGKRRPSGAGGPLRLAYFGFLWRGRNVETALRALKAVRDEGIEATLTLIGAVAEPAYFDALKALAQELDVASAVRFTGEVSPARISEELSQADVCLLPFATGVSTGRTTFFAALAHGVPIVTMHVDANLDASFQPGETFLSVPAGDEAEFIGQVVAAARDDALRERLAAGALALGRRYAWPTLAEQVAGIYRGLA